MRIPMILFTCWAGLLSAQEFQFVRVAGGTTARPDGRGAFNLNVLGRPATDGSNIVFTTVQAESSVWSYHLPTSTFVKLADTSTAAPGGTGTFTDFASLDSKPLLSDRTVVFLAYDQKARPNQGLYSVPVNGGAVTRIANYNSRSPGGVAFGDLDASFRQPFGGFAVHNRKAVFTVTLVDGNPGIYTANFDGSGLTRIADRDVRVPLPPPALFDVNIWQNPWIWQDRLYFYGQTLMDPSTGFNGIFTSGATGGGTPAQLYGSGGTLPGNSGGRARIRVPSIQADEQSIAFVADDPAQGGERRFTALYRMPRAGGALATVADINTPLPGMGPLLATSFASFSLNNGRILFRATGPNGGQALWLWRNGSYTKLIANGDLLDGRPVRQVLDVSPQAMNGDVITFLIEFLGGPLAVYAAVPVAAGTQVRAVQNGASYALNKVAPGGVLTLYGTGMGPDELSAFILDGDNRIPRALMGTRVLFNGIAAPVLYTSANQVSVIAPFSLSGSTSAEVRVQYQDRVSAPLTVPVVEMDPALFAADGSGSGPGAILNEDGSVNTPSRPAARGSVVVLFGAGFGPTEPALVEGQITPTGPVLPRLRSNVAIAIGGQAAPVLYQGPAPGAIAGLYQFNVRIPANAGSGNQAVRVTMQGAATQEGITVAVSP